MSRDARVVRCANEDTNACIDGTFEPWGPTLITQGTAQMGLSHVFFLSVPDERLAGYQLQC